jgi:hypothetical protein
VWRGQFGVAARRRLSRDTQRKQQYQHRVTDRPKRGKRKRREKKKKKTGARGGGGDTLSDTTAMSEACCCFSFSFFFFYSLSVLPLLDQ